MDNQTIPWRNIETLFLDVGNTLTSIDFDWVAQELTNREFPVDGKTLQRAEARARPSISRRFGQGTKIDAAFAAYLEEIFDALGWEPAVRTSLQSHIPELQTTFWVPGEADRLWRTPMPGIADALQRAIHLGLQCIAVSNSDGTAARSLEVTGLDQYVDLVIDSHIEGVEKPDPKIFEIALERSRAQRETTLHISDMYFADIVGARRAGISAVLLDPYDDWDDPDCVRLPDVGAVVERIEHSSSST